MSAQSKPVYFRNLDAVRFIAAMMVFLQHAVSPAYEHLGIEGSLLHRALLMVSSGETGVSVFFVLSGFLITFLIITEIERKGRLNIKRFYQRRFLRIWPLYFAVVLFSFGIYPPLKELFDLNNPLGSNVAYHLAFLSNFDVINIKHSSVPTNALSQNITWSVSVEEQFYLFWPLVFLLPRKLWAVVLVALASFSIGFRYMNAADDAVIYFHTFAVLIDLVIGGLFALSVKQSTKLRKLFGQANMLSNGMLLATIIWFLLVGKDLLPDAHKVALERLITAVLFGSLIASLALTNSTSRFSLHNWRFATRWGKYTYGIYLLHPIAITLINVSLKVVGWDYKAHFGTHIAIACFMLACTLALSWLSYTYFESYFLRIKAKLQVVESTSQKAKVNS